MNSNRTGRAPSGRRRAEQPAWFRALRAGDVLRTPSGDLRVVRAATFFADGDLRAVTLAIRKCSWTRRAYTVLNFTDLRLRGFCPIGVRVELNTKLDKRLALELAGRRAAPAIVSCCQARGLP